MGGQASSIQGTLNFSRDMEREADRIGFSVLTGAGYAPSGMAAMFEKLERASRLNDAGAFPYLRTHPLNAARIGEARSRMGAAVVPSAQTAGRLEHALIRARARVLMDPRVEALRRWQALAKEGNGKDTTEWLEAAEVSGEPTLIAGDFNATPDELPVSRWFAAAGWQELGGLLQPATCLPSRGQPRHIDWLLASRGLRPAVRGPAVVRCRPSRCTSRRPGSTRSGIGQLRCPLC